MRPNNRKFFDRQVEWVLARLPQKVFRLLTEVPLHVEDQPSKQLMRELKIGDADELCGYFCGMPKSKSNAYFGSNIYFTPDAPILTSITIFRRGIVATARNEQGKVSKNELREQIRITILHELAHYHGIEEEELVEIGYG